MEFENRFNGEFISTGEVLNTNPQRKTLEMLEHELLDINENLTKLDEKQRILANLSKLYI